MIFEIRESSFTILKSIQSLILGDFVAKILLKLENQQGSSLQKVAILAGTSETAL